jgi:hypothetical protein
MIKYMSMIVYFIIYYHKINTNLLYRLNFIKTYAHILLQAVCIAFAVKRHKHKDAC